MSDTTNRDKGRKVAYQCKYKRYCGCWHCEDGQHKKRIMLARSEKKFEKD